MNRRSALGTLFAAPLAAVAAWRPYDRDETYREWFARYQRCPWVELQVIQNEMMQSTIHCYPRYMWRGR